MFHFIKDILFFKKPCEKSTKAINTLKRKINRLLRKNRELKEIILKLDEENKYLLNLVNTYSKDIVGLKKLLKDRTTKLDKLGYIIRCHNNTIELLSKTSKKE